MDRRELMHESSLGKDLLQAVLAQVERDGCQKVLAVRGSVAETEVLSAEAVGFHFGAFAVGTPAEGAKLELETIHVRAKCKGCGEVYLPDHHVTLCPKCSGTEADLLEECGVRITELEVS
jgi:hydrogenase nickel incorporation protein HypA/HybF